MITKKHSINFHVVIFSAVSIIVLAALVLSVCVGKYPISLEEIWRIFTGQEVLDLTKEVFWTLRFPRTVMTLMAGIALGMAGSVYQTIFKNPLAAPDIIGVASGANLGAAAAILFFNGATVLVAGSAFIGGLVAVFCVIFLVRSTHMNNTASFVLSGIVINAVAEALIMSMKYFSDQENQLASIEFWAMGSFGNITASKVELILPVFLVGVLGMLFLRRQIVMMSLDEDESRMLGLNVRQIRFAILGFSTLAVASVISLTGIISFVGLIAPHIARLILHRNNSQTMVLSSLIGAAILILADCLARTIYSAELPISILTTLLGVPFLIYFMCSRKKGNI